MKNREWRVLDTGIGSAAENMRLDAELLQTLDPQGSPILHFYDWKGDCATYGHFVNPADFLNLQEAKQQGLDLAKRPTGGGIVFHIWDLAFSVLVPAEHPRFSEKTLDNYAFVNQAVLDAVSVFLKKEAPLELIQQDALAVDVAAGRFCMARPTKYDLVLRGKKIAGAAQRKTKQGFLHQGTIALKMPSLQYLQAILLPHTQVGEAMEAHTFALLESGDHGEEAKAHLKNQLEYYLKRE